ncbi:metal ABC transporter solute-binding protein, Zn/Mn family [Salirhabdus sp. Marseille-P4669]|uniref:metal ABC transporter solute-binding protein, Zn/Mn family n=1 Tax=Salirhabdus sp. Marseille-P4669 TaxID=2042310 RepID=UPI000C7CF0F1|nr:zinc ABC transporter substrate-binding protein [Salirhabdus sp. Marseille-P4669]
MLRKNTFIFGLSLLMISTVVGCKALEKNTSTDTESQKVKIYTTIYPLADFTQKIAGDLVDVESIIPSGTDSHTFEPSSKQMIEIAQADAFIYNGFGLEPYAETITDALHKEDTLMIEATKSVETIQHEHNHAVEVSTDLHEEEEHDLEHAEESTSFDYDDHGHSHGDMDPHVWLDPYRSITVASNIRDSLVELMPEAEDTFNQNFEALKKELEALDKEFHTLIESKENPQMIVSHAAYGYWEEAYGIQQIAITGISPTDEPSQKELEEIIKLANDLEISYLIFEKNVSPSVARVIQDEIQAEPLYLNNLETLTEEDMENGEDYFSLMRKNLETLDLALD